MTQPAWVNPIEQVFGREAASGSPFALLGLEPKDWDDATLVAARDARVARLDAHPIARTPAGEDVRVALYAATAQLLNDVVRRHLLQRWGGQQGERAAAQASASPAEHGPGPQADAAAFSAPRSPAEEAFVRDVTIAIGLHGGWSPGAVRHLAAVAAVHGLPPDRIAEAVASALAKPAVLRAPARVAPRPAGVAPRAIGGASPSAAPAEAGPDVVDDAPAPPSDGLARSLATSALVLVGFLVLGSILLAVDPGDAPAPSEPAQVAEAPPTAAPPARRAEPEPAPDAATPPDRAETPAPAPPDLDPEAVRRTLAAAASSLPGDADKALAEFRRAADALAAQWPDLPPSELTAANARVVEFVVTASARGDAAERAIEAIERHAAAFAPRDGRAGPRDLLRSAWGAGVLLRLRGQPGLSAALERRLERAAASVAAAMPRSGAFADGALAVLAAAPPRLADGAGPVLAGGPEVWDAWRRAVLAAAPEGDRNVVLLRAIETLLLAAEPDASPAAARGVQAAVAGIDWSADLPRRWLLDALAGDAYSGADVRAITEALATGPAPAGVTADMVLPRDADSRQRRTLRERFAEAWGLGAGAAESALVARLRARLGELAAADPGAPEQALARAAEVAYLNAAASLAWAGSGSEAENALAEAGRLTSRPPPKAPGTTTGLSLPRPAVSAPTVGIQVGQIADGAENAWAVRFLTARDASDKLALLNAFPPSNARTPADAEVLVEAAVSERARGVRERAAEVVRSESFDPLVVNGLLEVAPRLPRTPPAAALVEHVTRRTLPSRFGVSWATAARRALVERLLELLGSSGGLGASDGLAAQIALAYESALGSRGASSTAPLEPQQAAQLLRRRWAWWGGWGSAGGGGGRTVYIILPEAAPAEVERRLAGRLSLARGPVQVFAAEQLALLETAAGVIAAEQPARAREVQRILEEALDAHRAARHVYDQIRIAEEARLRLWLVRFEGAAP